MPIYQPIDYAQAYFQEPVLPKILGKPTYEKLKRLKKSLSRNAASVQSNLGGGAHGHLGLVLDDESYFTATGHHYIAPIHPGNLVIPAGTAHHEAVRLRDEYYRNEAAFRATIDVRNALLKQITSSIDDDYLKELQDDVTGTINQPIPDVLEFLFTRYGKVNSEEVEQEEKKVRSFTWNISDPPVCIFNMIDKLAKVAEAANLEKTEAQLVDYGLNIIRNTGEFETAILEWNAKDAVDKTWYEFKTHFTDAHTALSEVRGTSMRGTHFHQANATIEALRTDMSAIRNDLMEGISALTGSSSDDTDTENTPPAIYPDLSMNSINAQTNAALLSAIQNLTNQITQLTTESNLIKNRYSRPSTSTTQRQRRNTSKYCWSHGACAHASHDCNSKKPGHIDTATFANKQGGSTAYCGNRT